MPIVTLQMDVNSASVALDTLEMHTAVVKSHHDRLVNQIHVHQMVNVSFKRMVNQFAIVHSEWEVIQQMKDVTVTNVMLIVIVLNSMLA